MQKGAADGGAHEKWGRNLSAHGRDGEVKKHPSRSAVDVDGTEGHKEKNQGGRVQQHSQNYIQTETRDAADTLSEEWRQRPARRHTHATGETDRECVCVCVSYLHL